LFFFIEPLGLALAAWKASGSDSRPCPHFRPDMRLMLAADLGYHRRVNLGGVSSMATPVGNFPIRFIVSSAARQGNFMRNIPSFASVNEPIA
jgi:hypothetical protein